MKRLLFASSTLAAAALFAACGASSSAPPAPPASSPDAGAAPASYPLITLAPEPQRPGDATKGYDALVNEPYVPCGFPYSAYVKGKAYVSGSNENVPGRTGRNATLPYAFTSFTTAGGVELVTENCLTCHAGHINGQLVVGLGAADGDFTQSEGSLASAVGLFVTDPNEKVEYDKWKTRVETIAPYAQLSTKGPNPADGFTAVLFAHHDAATNAWSDTPLMDVPAPEDVPVDVPPWWRMKKKSSMFYVGAGRGDHARIMMAASILCTSTTDEEAAIDSYFPDIHAWITSLDPPKYPFAIDPDLASRGASVFAATCARCHGDETGYPNRVITLPEIGTDPILASGTAQFAAPFVAWFKDSFFGQLARLEPQTGYVAPPLDGIWATAPFLHNGSVPTIAALLDSSQRPAYWTRTFDSTDYDQANVGWNFTALAHGKDPASDAATNAAIYDTSLPGYSNAGHTFGDALSADDRAAVIEYLKTL